MEQNILESEDQNFIENELLFQNSKTQIYSYPGAVPLHVSLFARKNQSPIFRFASR